MSRCGSNRRLKSRTCINRLGLLVFTNSTIRRMMMTVYVRAPYLAIAHCDFSLYSQQLRSTSMLKPICRNFRQIWSLRILTLIKPLSEICLLKVEIDHWDVPLYQSPCQLFKSADWLRLYKDLFLSIYNVATLPSGSSALDLYSRFGLWDFPVYQKNISEMYMNTPLLRSSSLDSKIKTITEIIKSHVSYLSYSAWVVKGFIKVDV